MMKAARLLYGGAVQKWWQQETVKGKRRPGASNGRRYPLPCCTHLGNGWTDGRMDVRTDGWTDGLTNGRTDGRTEIIPCVL